MAQYLLLIQKAILLYHIFFALSKLFAVKNKKIFFNFRLFLSVCFFLIAKATQDKRTVKSYAKIRKGGGTVRDEGFFCAFH